MSRPIVVATANTPNKRNLPDSSRQAAALLELAETQGITHIACQEVYRGLRAALWKRRRRWRTVNAAWNNVLRRNRIGNAILFDKSTWGFTYKSPLKLEMPGRPRGLNFLVLHSRRESDGFEFTMIGGHFPTRGAASQHVWDEMASRVRGRISNVKGPLVLACDFNRPRREVAAAFPNLTVAASSGPDHILVRGFEVAGSREIERGFNGVVSDHRAIVAAELRRP